MAREWGPGRSGVLWLKPIAADAEGSVTSPS